MQLRLLCAALLAATAPLAAAPLAPDAGAFKAQGEFTDADKHVGQWHAEGTLHGGEFAGTLALELMGATHSVTLTSGRAFVRKGACVLRGGNGRDWVELSGACDNAAIGPGSLTGAFDGHGLRGTFEGTLTLGAALSASAAPPARPAG